MEDAAPPPTPTTPSNHTPSNTEEPGLYLALPGLYLERPGLYLDRPGLYLA
ncbi:hypothetical protein NHH00_04990 [Cellulosimicrobium cellulans]|nr:hypothetical protein [Cellulosimicrobium cellulans]